MSRQDPILLGSQDVLKKDGDDVYYTTVQDIPDFFLDDLADQRLQSKTERCGNFHKVASIPEGVINTMIRSGLDFYNAPGNEIVRWLRVNGFDHLFATSKNITFEYK